MKRKLTLLSTIVVVFVLLIPSSALAGKHFGIRYTSLDYQVNNLPEDFRFVPIHPDDDYASLSDNGIINQKEFDRDHWVSLEYGYGWEKDRWDLGIGFLWIYSAIGKFDDVKLRNYTNHPGTSTRGYGAALTFAGTEVRGLIPAFNGDYNLLSAIFNFTPKVFAEYSLDKNDKFRIGASLSYHQFNAINGWDRHNRYEIDKTKTLAHIYPLTLEITLYNCLRLGMVYNLHELTSFGEEAETEIGKRSYTVMLEHKF